MRRTRVNLTPSYQPTPGWSARTKPQTGSNSVTSGLYRTDRKSTRLNSSHRCISYAVFCLKKKTHPHVDLVLHLRFLPQIPALLLIHCRFQLPDTYSLVPYPIRLRPHLTSVMHLRVYPPLL